MDSTEKFVLCLIAISSLVGIVAIIASIFD